MRKFTTMAIALLMIAGFTPELKAQKSNEKTVVIEASLTCGACKAEIEKDIAFERGVKAVEADPQTKMVTIRYQENRNSDDKLVKAIEKLGYTAKVVDQTSPKEDKSTSEACPKKSDGCCGKKG